MYYHFNERNLILFDLDINNARRIILNPGEVLFLPNDWWHYVENLETAISINVWIPQVCFINSITKRDLISSYISQKMKKDESKKLSQD